MTTASGGGRIAEAGDDALLRAAALGDREAFEVVVHRYGPPLHRYARRLVANEADAADVVQATFIAAWRQLATFQGRSSLKTWLFSICSHKITDNYRVKRAQPIDDQLMEAIPAPSAAPTRSRRRRTRRSWRRWRRHWPNFRIDSAHHGYCGK